jgi:hypothetical protein
VPRPLDQAGLFVGQMPRTLHKAMRGRPAFALAQQGGRTLVELLSSKGAEGFQPMDKRAAGLVRRALGTIAPSVMIQRAQFVARSARELETMLLPVFCGKGSLSGVIHLVSGECVKLSFQKFRGNCLLSFAGPVEVGEIRLDDPSRDSLTIVASGRLLVTGRRVEAHLVASGCGNNGLVLAQRTHVRGSVVCRQFPRAAGLTIQEFGGSRFEHDPRQSSGTSPAANPDQILLTRYVAALSPYPISVKHTRD